jgi:hypothetical protein
VALTPASDDELIDRSVALAAELLVAARAGTSRRSASPTPAAPAVGQRVGHPTGLRPGRPGSATHRRPDGGRQLVGVTAGDLAGVSTPDRALLRLGSVAAAAPGPVVGLVAARLRRETGSLVYPAEPAPSDGGWPGCGRQVGGPT